MAKRIIAVDGGDPGAYELGSTIDDVLKLAGSREDVPQVIAGGEVITPEDYRRPAPPHGMITNATPIKKGGIHA